MLKNFEHVGVTIGDLDNSLASYCDLLGLKPPVRRTSPNGGTEVAFVDAGGPT